MAAFKRVMLKLSGEVLCGPPVNALHPEQPERTETQSFGIDPHTLGTISKELAEVHAVGVGMNVVIGGGNIFRGLKGSAAGMDRTSADYMGMLATIMNGLALQDSLEKQGVPTRLLSALECRQVAEPYNRRRALRHLEKGRLLIFAAGTGNPYFSTDTGAALRAMEIQAEVLLKATKVDGIYDKDPVKHADAVMLPRVTYDRFLADKLGVMDSTAITLCRDNKLPIRVFALHQRGNIRRVVQGEDVGTWVSH